MPFAAALSEHPDAAVAVGEVTGQVLDVLGADGPPPDLALLFLTGHHAAAVRDVAAVVRALLRPGTLVGATAAAVVGPAREVEDAPGISLWAGRFGPAHPARIDAGRLDTIEEPPFEPVALLLLADPFSFPADAAFAALAARWPGLPVVGGLASAARGPGGNRLLLDDRVVTAGAVGAFLGPSPVDVQTVVSQGGQPIGRPFAVTAADGPVVRELAGRPALERLLPPAPVDGEGEAPAVDVATLQWGGLHVGRLVDPRRLDPGRGDFLVSEVVDADPAKGTVTLADDVAVGDVLQYHLRDADSADDDLRALLTGRTADAALVFTGLGRGRHLFDARHHEARVVDEYLGRPAAAGMFCAGTFGPVGGRNFVHGLTASIALLREEGRFGR